jgi:hypothetical protein
MRPGRPASEEAGRQIHTQNAIPGFIRFRGKHFAGAASGVVDEDVQAAIEADSFCDGRFHGRAVGDIAREKSDVSALGADCLLDRVTFRFPAGQNRCLRSFLCKAASGGFANSAVATGD